MALTIASREVDGVTVLDLSGRITLGEGSVQLRDAIRDLISKGQKKILLNLGDVNYIDSSGLGEMVSAYTTARNQGATLKLLKLNKKVHDLLQLTKLYTVFDISDDEASAIASFKWPSVPGAAPTQKGHPPAGWPLSLPSIAPVSRPAVPRASRLSDTSIHLARSCFN